MTKFTPDFERRYPWCDRLIAIIAAFNLMVVFFDLSYLQIRDFYLQTIPSISRYDSIKGIKPHPETVNYLHQVEALSAQVVVNGLQSPQVNNKLAQLRQQGELCGYFWLRTTWNNSNLFMQRYQMQDMLLMQWKTVRSRNGLSRNATMLC